ncbi:matrixin family metalloprotease [Zooshikella sp. RANM57]|uniref:matrixin family metalloprotease n=1 Tax=Zooshikella sp. RANM57 TaxID=3425863 RepID=UPI003D6EC59B
MKLLVIRLITLFGVGICSINFALAGGDLIKFTDNGDAVPAKWDKRMLPISYVLSDVGYLNSEITNEQIGQEINNALNKWEEINTSYLKFKYLGEVSKFSHKAESIIGTGVDGYNLITFSDPDIEFDEETLAYCMTTITSSELTVTDINNDLNGDGKQDIPNGIYPRGTIIDADIVFDGKKIFKLTKNDDGNDLQSVLLHEIGHCFGLSHSSIKNSIMFPFVNNDFEIGRTLHSDDIAYISKKYPLQENYSNNYGLIKGKVIDGATSKAIVGAHVYAADPLTKNKIVGSYSLKDGIFEIPVPKGNYIIGIEPLDGDPRGLEPERINPIIRNTLDTDFPEEYYNENESAVDGENTSPKLFNISELREISDINFITNSVAEPNSYWVLNKGINYLSYPVSSPEGIDAFSLLKELRKASNIQSIQRFNSKTGTFEKATFDSKNDEVYGYNFPIKQGVGYIIHSKTTKIVGLIGSKNCPKVNLYKGMNLIGVGCIPGKYSAFDWLKELGTSEEVKSIEKYNIKTKKFEIAYYDKEQITGDNFKLNESEAYIVRMAKDKENLQLKSHGNYAPVITLVSPGKVIIGSVFYIDGQGFNTDISKNVVIFNKSGLEIISAKANQLVVKASSKVAKGLLKVKVAGLESNEIPFEIVPQKIKSASSELVNGQKVSATLNELSDIDEFSFIGISGNKININFNVLNQNSILELALIDPNGAVVKKVRTGKVNQILINNFEITNTGLYRLQVSIIEKSGKAEYRLDFNIKGKKKIPEVHITSGNGQTAIAGAELGLPVEVITSGPTGFPAAGIPVTFEVQRRDNASIFNIQKRSMYAASINNKSFSVNSNSQGVVAVKVLTPNQKGVYDIIVSAPNMKPAILTVSVVEKQIKKVLIKGKEQKGIVGKTLKKDYSIQFLDESNEPVSQVMTNWKIMNKAGKIKVKKGVIYSNNNENEFVVKTDDSGIIQVSHQLGEKAYFDDFSDNPNVSLINFPHQVIATIPGHAAPVIFSSIGKPDIASDIEIIAAPYNRLSIGTVRSNAVKVKAYDKYKNPAPNAQIKVDLPDNLQLYNGEYKGKIYTSMKTDERGLWVGGIGAKPGFKPSFDEFGVKIGAPFQCSVNVGSETKNIFIAVDMGPTLVTSKGSNSTGYIGKSLEQPVKYKVFRFQRVDRYIPIDSEGNDDDSGDWTDEDYSKVRRIDISGVTVNLGIRRDDKKDLSSLGLNSTTINGTTNYTVKTDENGVATINKIKAGDISGIVQIVSSNGGSVVPFFYDNFHKGQSGKKFKTQQFIGETITTSINIKPVKIQLIIKDPFPETGLTVNNDVYPTIGKVSGIDLSELKIKLHKKSLLSPGVNGEFPYYRQIVLDNVAVSNFNDSLFSQKPSEITIIYFPTAKQIRQGNELVISGLKDSVGNTTEEKVVQFPVN